MVGNILGGAVVETLSTRVRIQVWSRDGYCGRGPWIMGRGPGSYGPVGRISVDKVRDTSELQLPFKKKITIYQFSFYSIV